MQREVLTDIAFIEPAPGCDAELAAGVTEAEVLIEPQPSLIGQLVGDFKVAAELKDPDDAKARMHAAFKELVLATQANTYTLAYRLTGDEETAQEVCQDAYLRAYRGLRRFRGDAAFTTWLFRITTNIAMTELGRQARHRHESFDVKNYGTKEIEDTRSMGPEDRMINSELSTELQNALTQLTPGLRAVVVLRDIYDLPHEGIAKKLGISESAAKVRLHRARRILIGLLNPPRTAETTESTELSTEVLLGGTALQNEVS